MSKWVNKERQKCVSVRINLPSGIITNKAVKITVSDDFNSLEIIMASSPYLPDVQCMQNSLSKDAVVHHDDRPKIAGHRACFEELRKQESDDIFLKSTIALPFPVKKKIEKKKFLKGMGARVVEVDLVSNETNNRKEEESESDFSSDEE